MGYGYFSEAKKKRAIEDLHIIHECAEQVGIKHALFVGFGLLLGIIRERDFIAHDSDVDMCVRSDLITADQELAYYKALDSQEMFFARRRKSFRDDPDGFLESAVIAGSNNAKKRFAWFSLRRRDNHCKFCHWFMFPWAGFLWHTKAGKWVDPRKFGQQTFDYDVNDEGIMKGIPYEFASELIQIDFYDLKLNIPRYYGMCLDFWYPGWITPRGGSSSKQVIAVVKKWSDQRTWRRVK